MATATFAQVNNLTIFSPRGGFPLRSPPTSSVVVDQLLPSLVDCTPHDPAARTNPPASSNPPLPHPEMPKKKANKKKTGATFNLADFNEAANARPGASNRYGARDSTVATAPCSCRLHLLPPARRAAAGLSGTTPAPARRYGGNVALPTGSASRLRSVTNPTSSAQHRLQAPARRRVPPPNAAAARPPVHALLGPPRLLTRVSCTAAASMAAGVACSACPVVSRRGPACARAALRASPTVQTKNAPRQPQTRLVSALQASKVPTSRVVPVAGPRQEASGEAEEARAARSAMRYMYAGGRSRRMRCVACST